MSQVASSGSIRDNRWFQLVSAIIMMVMIACLQYAWELHADPLKQKLGVDLSAIQAAFTVYVIFQTVIQPGGGFIVDKYGPKLTILAGAAVGFGWVMMGQVNSVVLVCIFYALAGSGAGIVYGCCVGMASKWFPDKKGLASGLIAAGYGMGALPFIPAINATIKSSGIDATFLKYGLIMGVVIVIFGFMLKFPPSFDYSKSNAKKVVKEEDFTPGEMLKTKHFWVLYIIFAFVNLGGLLITANSVPYGKSIGIPAAALTLAVSAKTFANGISRIGWGWISDKIGRYRSMGISFVANAVALVLLPIIGKTPMMYVVMMFIVIFTWGSCYSLFPAATSDTFGAGYTTSNYGFVYSGKGLASVFGGGVGAAVAASFGWNMAFFIAAATSLIAAVLAAWVVPNMGKPVNKRMLANKDNSNQASV